MKEINGEDYSRESFEDYELRVKVEIVDKDGKDHNFDIYTTEKDVNVVSDNLSNITTKKVTKLEITNCATKEQDDLMGEFIDKL